MIKKVKGEYQANHPRMRQYRNVVLYILKMFQECILTVVPRNQNLMADSLAKVARNFKIPIFSNRKFEIHVKHRPTVPDNSRYWQVFGDDKHVNKFLQGEEEFENCSIDEICDKDD